MKIVSCILPAHNEEDCIRQTVESLMQQTYPPAEVIVVADNCSDQTVPILTELVKQYGDRGFSFFESVNNKAKKAGALNQALQKVRQDADYLLQMDSDTVLDLCLIEEAIKELTYNESLGGVCSRFGVRGFQGGNWKNWILWKAQHIEYSLYDSIRVETLGRIKVLSGTVTVFRAEAIRQVEKLHEGEVWSETSIVEDYALTLDLKSLGWKTTAGMGMYSFTDTMPTLKDLWKQRHRWYTGTFEELTKRGWTASTRADIMDFALFFFLLSCQLLFLTVIASFLIIGIPIQIPLIGFITIGIVWLNKIYRVRYIQERRWYDVLIVAFLLPEEIYSLFRNIIIVSGLVSSIRRTTVQW